MVSSLRSAVIGSMGIGSDTCPRDDDSALTGDGRLTRLKEFRTSDAFQCCVVCVRFGLNSGGHRIRRADRASRLTTLRVRVDGGDAVGAHRPRPRRSWSDRLLPRPPPTQILSATDLTAVDAVQAYRERLYQRCIDTVSCCRAMRMHAARGWRRIRRSRPVGAHAEVASLRTVRYRTRCAVLTATAGHHW